MGHVQSVQTVEKIRLEQIGVMLFHPPSRACLGTSCYIHENALLSLFITPICPVWMAPAKQDIFEVIDILSEAVLCSACLRGALDRWP